MFVFFSEKLNFTYYYASLAASYVVYPMNIKENNGAIFLKFYGPIFSNCVSLEMLSKYNEIVFPFALLSQQSPALWPSCGRINSVLEFIVGKVEKILKGSLDLIPSPSP